MEKNKIKDSKLWLREFLIKLQTFWYVIFSEIGFNLSFIFGRGKGSNMRFVHNRVDM